MSTIALTIESDGPGGAERMVLHMADELRRRGHHVIPVGPAVGCGWLAEQFRERGFTPEGFVLRHALDLGCVRSLAEIFRRRRVEAVHSHEFTMAVFGAAATRRVGIPHIVTMHGGTAFARRWRRRTALRWAIRRSRSTVTVSETSRTDLASRVGVDPGRLRVVPNGIPAEPGDRAPVRAELGVADHEPLLVAVGNLYPVKGHIVLLRALARLHRTQPELAWRLAIAGRGGEETALRHFANEHGIGDRVHLLGYRKDVPDILAAADLYAMPSLSEGMPLALVEAMLAGRAVVASRVGGIPEVVSHGQDGLLVPPGDAEALADAVRELLADPGRRDALGNAARRRAERDFSVAAMVDAYEELYSHGDEETEQ